MKLSDVGDTDGKRKRVHLLTTGTFNHPLYGRFSITASDLKLYKENFDRNVRGIEVQANYDHGEDKARGNEASGWIKSLTIEADGKELWSETEFTDDAFAAIKAKKWKYASPEISRSWKHPESGQNHSCVLTGFALTNQPFFKGLQPIAASEHITLKDTPMKLTELTGLLFSEHGINLTDLQAKAAKADGLEAEKTQMFSELTAAKAQVTTLGKTNAELTAKVELVEKEAVTAKFNDLVKRGMDEGRITKAFAEGTLKTICDAQGFAFAEKMVNELPKNGAIKVGDTTGSTGEGGEGGGKKFNTPDEEVTFKANELMKKDKKLSFNEAVDQVFSDDPKLLKRYGEYEPKAVETSGAD